MAENLGQVDIVVKADKAQISEATASGTREGVKQGVEQGSRTLGQSIAAVLGGVLPGRLGAIASGVGDPNGGGLGAAIGRVGGIKGAAVLGGIAIAAGAAIIAIKKSIQVLNRWSDNVGRSVQTLARFDGGIASMAIQTQLQGLQLDMNRAARLSPSLIEAQTARLDRIRTFQPTAVSIQQFQNRIVTLWERMLTQLSSVIVPVFSGLTRYLEVQARGGSLLAKGFDYGSPLGLLLKSLGFEGISSILGTIADDLRELRNELAAEAALGNPSGFNQKLLRDIDQLSGGAFSIHEVPVPPMVP